MSASRRGGVNLEDICAEFDVSHRTAKRMTEALEATFANVSATDDAERRRYWRLDAPLPDRLQPRQETAIEALEIAARTARECLPETIGLRAHRAISWIGRAEVCGEDDNARFNFLRTTFKAALLRKNVDRQASAFSGRTCPTGSLIGVPGTV
ncbi:hypothetical protein [Leisingera sp.]|uniref:hypothetical protein n=1 Tax=Leisingera sp. TaxID=1879318 RepID=UPI003A93BF8F